jgi:chromosomal replication initiation ATPase DnaA
VTHYPTRSIASILCELDIRDLTMQASRIAGQHFCSLEEMLGPKRLPRFAAARQQFWSELYYTGLYSLPVLGAIFDRDHKTILHGIREHGSRVQAARLRARRCA